MIHEDRIKQINGTSIDDSGEYVLYWMQAAQRTIDNPALDFAISLANRKNCPLLVLFVVMPDFPNANKRHFTFMLEGIKDVQMALKEMGIGFTIQIGRPELYVSALARKCKALVMDMGYSKYDQLMRTNVTKEISKATYIIETNLIVPVEIAYAKEAYAAYALRPSIMRKLHTYLEEGFAEKINHRYNREYESLELTIVDDFISEHLPKLKAVQPSKVFKGGQVVAIELLEAFIASKLSRYEATVSDPSAKGSSLLSPYLHFGQLSPMLAVRSVLTSGIPSDAFVEQLVVRRELAYNYVYYSGDKIKTLSETLPTWAYESLMAHQDDPRPITYDLESLENANTHDPYWNAAQLEMVYTGHMHNTMRMYWGKKVIEWTESPETAFQILNYLNDKYELDGRDPNGYAGIAWCFGKHDRPWQERPIFGKIRYMNAAGLRRKYDIEAYVAAVRQLEGVSFGEEQTRKI